VVRRKSAPGAASGPATEGPSSAVLDDIVRRLVEALRPERIYLFGSRARGDAHADSDYDLMVLVSERVGPGREMERRANAAFMGLTVPIDVVILTTEYFTWMLGAAASLSATVGREGRLVYAA
jgi:uncharacterized protein